MKNTKIALRYAKALFELAEENNLLASSFNDMQLVYDVCKTSSDFKKMLTSPIVKYDKKKAIFNQIFEAQINKISLAFILIIAQKRREVYLQDIAENFISLYKDFKNIQVVTINTAKKLEPNYKTNLIEKLTKFTNKEIELIENIDSSIIGGFIINIGDRKYDTSIKNRVLGLKKEFINNVYVSEI